MKKLNKTQFEDLIKTLNARESTKVRTENSEFEEFEQGYYYETMTIMVNGKYHLDVELLLDIRHQYTPSNGYDDSSYEVYSQVQVNGIELLNWGCEEEFELSDSQFQKLEKVVKNFVELG